MKTTENATNWYRQKTIDQALSVSLADGVFIIVFYNSQHSRRAPEQQIDPFTVFGSLCRNEIQQWIDRSKQLMATNYPVGDALVGKSDRFEEIRDEYIKDNPGFSKETYSHAIHVGASKACH